MSVPLGELIAQADMAVVRLGHAPSTLWQFASSVIAWPLVPSSRLLVKSATGLT